MKKLFLFALVFSNLLLASSRAALPTAPSGLRSAWVDDSVSVLTWDPEATASSYNVYRFSGGEWTLVATELTATHFRESLYVENPPIDYAVTAVNEDGEGPAANTTISLLGWSDMYMTIYEPLEWMHTLTATNAILTWVVSPVSGADGMLEFGLAPDNYPFVSIETNYLGWHTFNLSDLTPLTMYYYRLTSAGTNRLGHSYQGQFATPFLNRPPIAQDVTIGLIYPWGLSVPLLGIDNDSPFPGFLTYRIATQPTNGYVSGIGWSYNGEYFASYTPNPGARGDDHFTYIVNDGVFDSAPGLVTITNIFMNRAPVANYSQLSTPEDTPISFTLSVSDPDGDPLTYTINYMWPGELSGTGPNYVYTPPTNFYGTVYIYYTVSDGYQYGSATASVYIDVTPVNDVPVAQDLTITVWEDESERWISPEFTDQDGSGAYTASAFTQPAHGSVTNFGFSLIYKPAPNFFGTDSFTYVVHNEGVTSAPATVTVNVLGVNDLGVLQDMSITTPEDVPATGTVTVADPDGDVYTLQLYTAPNHGVVQLNGMNFVYTPTTNYSGEDMFRVIAQDQNGWFSFNAATIQVSVTPVNDRPVANPKFVSTMEDTATNITLTGFDIDGGVPTATVQSSPTHGTLSGTAPNLVYTPDANFFGTDTFTFTVSDGMLSSTAATVTISVNPVNDAPVAHPQSVTVNEDSSVGVTLTGTDVEGSTLTATVQNGPAHGTLSGASPNLVYTPAANHNGSDSFTFLVNDGALNSQVATVSITVNPLNDAPVATAQSITINEDETVNITLGGSDLENNSLTATVQESPAHGTLTGTSPDYTYTPDANFSGADSFTFIVNDGSADSTAATVTITVTPVNDAPVATPQSVSLSEDDAISLTLAGSDVEGSALSVTVQSNPAHGTLGGTLPNLVYTPEANYSGTDSFTFVVNDGQLSSAAATVNITVNPVNDAPVANPLTLSLTEDTSKNFTLTGSDVEGSALTVIVQSNPAHGTLSGTAPDLVYTPVANFNGPDNFTFVVNDGALNSELATVTIMVNAVNDAPTANAQSLVVDEDTSLNLALNGSDPENSSLTAVVQSGPSHGTLSGTSPNLVYTPAPNYSGPDSFSFVVNDGEFNSAAASVSITVNPVNDAPVATPLSLTLSEDGSKSMILTGSDVDSGPLTMIVQSGPAHGTLSGISPNLVYTPAANFNGADSFTFVANDGLLNSAPVTVSITVAAVNDAPIASSQSITVSEDSPTLLALGSDVDGDSLTMIVQSAPTHGALSGTMPNVVYTPAANYSGPDSFTYRISDGTLTTALATVTITITPVNDAPVANTQTITLNEDTTKSLTLTGLDLEGSAVTARVVGSPAHGTLTGTAPNLVYRPATNYFGADSFTFVVNDGLQDSAPATVTITVNPVNDAPVAVAQTVSTAYNTPVSFTIAGTDVDGNPLTFLNVTSPNNGTLSGTAPNLTFTPNLNWSGTTTFTFKVNDGVVTSSSATVTITVAGPTAPPAAPSGLTATALSNSQISLSWVDNGNTETGFKIERSTDGTTWSQIATVGANVQTYTSSGLTKKKLYYYRVMAYNSIGNSAYSNTASATTL